VAYAAVVAAGLAIGEGCSRPDPPPPPPPPSADKVEQDLVEMSLHECLTLDCERAFAHVSTLPAKSPLRMSDAFHAIEYHYDADRLLRADIEPDLTKRRAMYKAVAESPTTDSRLVLAAAERVARLGVATAGASEVALNATASAAVEAAAASADLLAKSRSKIASDQNEVRAKLEPKVFAGKATRDDVAMLRTVCKAQKDTACLGQLDRLIVP
jgi:hypothetical protein